MPSSDKPVTDPQSLGIVKLGLQVLCKQRGITIRGTKSEVVLRLRHHDAGIVDQPTKGETDVPSKEATDVTPDAPSQEAATEDVTQHDDSRQESPNYEEE